MRRAIIIPLALAGALLAAPPAAAVETSDAEVLVLQDGLDSPVHGPRFLAEGGGEELAIVGTIGDCINSLPCPDVEYLLGCVLHGRC